MAEKAEEAYQSYYREVELQWSLSRGNQIIVSPIEFERIDAWYRNGIPLPVVIGAIRRFMERKQKSKRKRGYLLTHVDGDVEKLWQEYQALHVGERNGEGNESVIVKRIRSLNRKLNKAQSASPQLTPCIEEVAKKIKSIDVENIVQLEATETLLSTWDQQLLTSVASKLTAKERQDLENEVREFMDQEEDPALFDRMVADTIRFRFHLPVITVMV